MANAQTNLITETVGGPGPFTFHLPVDGGSHIYKGTLVSQLTATGAIVPYSTAATGHVVGVADMEADNTAGADGAKRCYVESHRAFAFTNGAGGDAFSEASLIGSVVYGTDDHTVAKTSSAGTRKPVGFFMGMEADGKVRVLVDPTLAFVVSVLQGLTDTPATADALRDNILASLG